MGSVETPGPPTAIAETAHLQLPGAMRPFPTAAGNPRVAVMISAHTVGGHVTQE